MPERVSTQGRSIREYALRQILLEDAREFRFDHPEDYFDLVYECMRSGTLIWITEDNGEKVPAMFGPNGPVKIYKSSSAPQSPR